MRINFRESGLPVGKTPEERKAITQERLARLCPRGTRVFAILRESNPRRQNVQFYVFHHGEAFLLSKAIAELLGHRVTGKCVVLQQNGLGDLALELVEHLSKELHGGEKELYRQWL